LTLAQTFTVLGVNADGSGTARLTCGFSGCPFNFEIQVSPDRSVFNLVTASANPGNFLEGVAIRRSTAGHIVKTNLAGPWQGAGSGIDDDPTEDVDASVLTFKLNAKAETKAVTLVSHHPDGDFTVTDLTLKVLTLNPDGSGTACLSFESECDAPLTIQVSPDRSIISGVDVTPDGEFGAGLLIHQ
jgi:hypothetical protein